MKQINTMPKKGQFIRCWIYNKHIWSVVFKWDGDTLMEYEGHSNQFIDSESTDPSSIGGEEVESIWITL